MTTPHTDPNVFPDESPAGFLETYNCHGCEHFDADHHCARPLPLVRGYIKKPHDVVCVGWQKIETER